jgi:spore coat polysaccharide biosynthesis protein SpsF (cytidylyltransferase family)
MIILSDFIRQTTESYSFIHPTQYIYEENNQYVLVHHGPQATFKSSMF